MTWEGKVTRDQAGHPNQGSLTREWSLNFHLEKLAATVLRYHPGPGFSTIADSLEEVKLPELALHRPRTATPCTSPVQTVTSHSWSPSVVLSFSFPSLASLDTHTPLGSVGTAPEQLYELRW